MPGTPPATRNLRLHFHSVQIYVGGRFSVHDITGSENFKFGFDWGEYNFEWHLYSEIQSPKTNFGAARSITMARFGGAVMRGISPMRGTSWHPLFRRAYGNYEEFDVFAGADTAEKVRINGYDENRFYANGVEVQGSIICLSRLTLKWTPKSFAEVTPDSLAIFELLRPAPEILILGCGKRMGRVSKELRDYLRSNGIKLEAIDTANATSTFNILNEEGRMVAAAMLPQGT